MLTFLNQYGRNYVYSQNKEEGVIEECLRRMGITSGVACEIGGSDGRFCSNTALLIDKNWRVLFVEADFGLYLQCRENWKHNARVRSQCSVVDAQNINAFVDDACDVLSIDCDGPDYEIFKGLEAKPKIVIVEIDSSIPPHMLEFNVDGGAGYAEMVMLGIRKGYFLLCHTGNLVFVDSKYRDLFPEITGDPLQESVLYFNRAWIKEAA